MGKSIEVLKRTNDLLDTKPFKEIGAAKEAMNIAAYKHTVFLSDKFHKCIIQQSAVTAYHPTSTCRMGPKSDQNSVVDHRTYGTWANRKTNL
ncbi:hypothetical protein DPMN_092857 [Dreissena polymorpha]|uniref:Glucose-methanol-choline oxidoreductase C-terminal domain-containing protein n=1 Tax=Dreissena polymorpha TaxID=45954 RepID=A0A9D4L2J6_DREPO|nr:hypothetical protein DPMN_092857 [Dreissena polymorpha]